MNLGWQGANRGFVQSCSLFPEGILSGVQPRKFVQVTMMATVTETPVNLRLKLADHVVRLGLWNECKLILEHTIESVPCLLSVSVELVRESEGVEDLVLILAKVDEDCHEQLEGEERRVEWNWDGWFVENFPSDLPRQFGMMVVQVAAIERCNKRRS